jgi:hypothetical protein
MQVSMHLHHWCALGVNSFESQQHWSIQLQAVGMEPCLVAGHETVQTAKKLEVA